MRFEWRGRAPVRTRPSLARQLGNDFKFELASSGWRHGHTRQDRGSRLRRVHPPSGHRQARQSQDSGPRRQRWRAPRSVDLAPPVAVTTLLFCLRSVARRSAMSRSGRYSTAGSSAVLSALQAGSPRRQVAFEVVRVLVFFAKAHGLAQRRTGVAQVQRYRQRALLFHVGLGRRRRSSPRCALGRDRQIHRRLGERELSLGHAHETKSVGRAMATRRALGSALPTSSAAKITIRRATKSGSSPAPACAPSSNRRIGVAAAHALDEGAHHFIVLVTCLVIDQCRAAMLLDGLGIDGPAASGRLRDAAAASSVDKARRASPPVGRQRSRVASEHSMESAPRPRLGSTRARSMMVRRFSWESGFSTTTLARE